MAVYEFKMPSLGADMEDGALIEWKIKPGDRVHRGDIVAVVDTAKAAIDVEIWADGVVDTLLVPEDPEHKLPVGTTLAILKVEEEGEIRPSASAAKVEAGPPVPAAGTSELGVSPLSGTRIRISPAARRRARELGVDPESVGAVVKDRPVSLEDVESFASRRHSPRSPEPEATAPAGEYIRGAEEEGMESVGPAPAEGTGAIPSTDRRQSMRRAIGQAMARSWREIPHYYLSIHADVTALRERLTRENEKRTVAERQIAAVYFIRAVALSVREVPEMNGFFVDGAFRASDAIHTGMAIALRGGGLVAPAIHDADQKSPEALMAALADLTERTRSYSLRSSELTDATITITSLGDPGVESVFGIIYPPQVALVGFGGIELRPACLGDAIVPRSMVTVTLSADHRVSDGRQGARFLQSIKELLEDPAALMGE